MANGGHSFKLPVLVTRTSAHVLGAKKLYRPLAMSDKYSPISIPVVISIHKEHSNECQRANQILAHRYQH